MYTSFDDIPLEKILRLLTSTDFVSGEKLSLSLKISRTAVWKNIKKLQRLGYKIESRPNIGYKLIFNPLLLYPWEITNGLQTDIIGRKIYYFDTIDSTQNFALKIAQKPHENGSVVIAKRQTMGRGRLNRKWISPKGGIWISILLRPNFDISFTSLFPMITSLALARAIENTLDLKPELKWPNDIMINKKKIAGILIDAAVESNKIDYLVIGVGINFKVQPEKIIKSILKDKRYDIGTLVGSKDLGGPARLVQQFLLELETEYNKIITSSVTDSIKEWKRRSSTIGRTVTVNTTTERMRGRAIGIDENGALVLSVKGKKRKILAGDISY